MNQNEFDFFLDELLSNAVEEFQSTEQYQLLEEKLKKMGQDCETMLTKDQQVFADECFELIKGVDGQKEQYVYQKGLRDSISILKWMGVLA